MDVSIKTSCPVLYNFYRIQQMIQSLFVRETAFQFCVSSLFAAIMNQAITIVVPCTQSPMLQPKMMVRAQICWNESFSERKWVLNDFGQMLCCLSGTRQLQHIHNRVLRRDLAFRKNIERSFFAREAPKIFDRNEDVPLLTWQQIALVFQNFNNHQF